MEEYDGSQAPETSIVIAGVVRGGQGPFLAPVICREFYGGQGAVNDLIVFEKVVGAQGPIKRCRRPFKIKMSKGQGAIKDEQMSLDDLVATALELIPGRKPKPDGVKW